MAVPTPHFGDGKAKANAPGTGGRTCRPGLFIYKKRSEKGIKTMTTKTTENKQTTKKGYQRQVRSNQRGRLLVIVEGAVMVALAFALDMVMNMLPIPKWPNGGSVSIGVVPLIYYAYRRGILPGVFAGIVYSGIQMVTGLYLPPANTFLSVVLCILLDYLLAFAAFGIAPLFAAPFSGRPKKRGVRLFGYGFGAAAVSLVRMVCSIVSGGLLWGSYAPEKQGVWVYTITYNAGYMIPNAVLAAILTVMICSALDPHTMRPMRRS